MIENAEARRQSDAPPEGTSPLSVQQHLWWSLDEAYGSANCQASARLEFQGRVDQAALRAAFERLLSRHSALRTRIRAIGGVPRRYTVAPPTAAAFVEHHLDGRWRAERLCALDARQPLSLRNGPLIRGSLMQLPDHSYVLQITLHQIVCDGESLNWLLRELLLLYKAGLTGNDDGLDGATIPYKQKLPANSMPVGVPRSINNESGVSSNTDLVLSDDLATRLRTTAREYGVSLYTILICAWVGLPGRGLGETDAVLGIETSGRSRPGQAPVIGPFSDLVPIRIRVDEMTPVGTLLQDINRAVNNPAHSTPESSGRVFPAGPGGRAKPVIPLAVCACPPLHLDDLASIDVPGITLEGIWTDRHWPCAEVSACFEEHGTSQRIMLRYANDIMEGRLAQKLSVQLSRLLDELERHQPGSASTRLPAND